MTVRKEESLFGRVDGAADFSPAPTAIPQLPNETRIWKRFFCAFSRSIWSAASLAFFKSSIERMRSM
jgi:anti-sigma factor RsiW